MSDENIYFVPTVGTYTTDFGEVFLGPHLVRQFRRAMEVRRPANVPRWLWRIFHKKEAACVERAEEAERELERLIEEAWHAKEPAYYADRNRNGIFVSEAPPQ